MSDIEFADLSLQDALDLAILVEDEAKERYEEFAELMTTHHTEDAAKFFVFMAANEAKHGDELRKRRSELFGEAPVQVDSTMIFDVEAPEPSEVRAFMSTRQALEVALAAETKAFQFFDSALPSITNDEVKELFSELRDEEVEHQDMVKEQLARLPEGPEADPDDYVDPPIGM